MEFCLNHIRELQWVMLKFIDLDDFSPVINGPLFILLNALVVFLSSIVINVHCSFVEDNFSSCIAQCHKANSTMSYS